MNRRDFLSTIGLAGVGLFLPKTFRPARWKPVLAPAPWDYEIALFDWAGREIAGAGYARLRGVGARDFKVLPAWAEERPRLDSSVPPGCTIVTARELYFPPAQENWGRLRSIQIINKEGHIFTNTSVLRPAEITTGIRVAFFPGDFRITMY